MALYDHIKPPLPPDPPLLGSDMGQLWQDKYYKYSPNDSLLWLELFTIADRLAGRELSVQLEIIRNTGAWLILDQQYGFKIQAVIGQNGWESIEQYNKERQWLVPHTRELISSLAELRNKFDRGKIF